MRARHEARPKKRQTRHATRHDQWWNQPCGSQPENARQQLRHTCAARARFVAQETSPLPPPGRRRAWSSTRRFVGKRITNASADGCSAPGIR
uniref:Uncharacterized protein n=1 Tax=Setaria viridis TaxID=4556 RepID=A0A4U6VXS1_SETVI|nr:hypothetical protein SEVIR_2G329150v2 [Setaria viridis]